MTARSYASLIMALIFALYLVSYLSLSRSGYAWADRYGSGGFYYFEPENSDTWRRKNFFCAYFFWPLNWIDQMLGFGRDPASEPLWELGSFGGGTSTSSLALRAP